MNIVSDPLSAITFISNQAKLDSFYMFVICNSQSFLTQILNLRVVGALGEKPDFLVPRKFKLKVMLIIRLLQ